MHTTWPWNATVAALYTIFLIWNFEFRIQFAMLADSWGFDPTHDAGLNGYPRFNYSMFKLQYWYCVIITDFGKQLNLTNDCVDAYMKIIVDRLKCGLCYIVNVIRNMWKWYKWFVFLQCRYKRLVVIRKINLLLGAVDDEICSLFLIR